MQYIENERIKTAGFRTNLDCILGMTNKDCSGVENLIKRSEHGWCGPGTEDQDCSGGWD